MTRPATSARPGNAGRREGSGAGRRVLHVRRGPVAAVDVARSAPAGMAGFDPETGKEFVLIVAGVVSRHPQVENGTIIGTGAAVWMDRPARFVRTHKRLRSLGRPADREG